MNEIISFIRFKNFRYKSKFDLDNNIGLFDEVFTDQAGKVRKNVHQLFMPPQKEILRLAKEAGFILEGQIDLMPVKYDNQYLYILYKPE